MTDLPTKLQNLLCIFKQHKALTDAELIKFYRSSKDPRFVHMSDTVIRKGRESLLELGLIQVSGQRKPNMQNRECILWEAVDSAG